MDDKQLLRDRLIVARKAHFAVHGVAAALDLARHAPALEVSPESLIAAYLPMGSEMDLRPLMETLVKRGHKLCLPVCLAEDAPVIFRHYAMGDTLAADAMGIDAPVNAAETVQPDVVLVPLLGFDTSGMRLGRGGGYYDRTLAELRARRDILACGVAFHMQMVDKCPSAPHDQALDAVLTEDGLTQFERE